MYYLNCLNLSDKSSQITKKDFACKKMSVLNYPDLAIDIDDQTKVISEAKKLANKIKPEWKEDKLKEKIFSDGITNVLVGIYQVSNTIYSTYILNF